MKVNLFALCISLGSASLLFATDGRSQNIEKTNVVLSLRGASLQEALMQIEAQSEFRFTYKKEQIALQTNLRLRKATRSVKETLDLLLTDSGIVYEQVGNYIVLTEDPKWAERISIPGMFTVSGKVSDEHGQPLPGVNILEKGTTNGTTTSADGEYMLAVADGNAMLVFSFIGYLSQDVGINGRSVIDVMLAPDVKNLEEVVVVGYGSRVKTKLTSAISEINTSDLKDLPAATSGQLLLGRSSGVSVTETSGAPGTPPSIQIHGISSINAGIAPLVVINGFPVGNGIPQSLNPNDIEKITILKDAASTSIYGARGTNGVILIETTKATASQTEIEYNTYTGVQYLPKSWRPDLLNAVQYAQYNKERVEEINAMKGSNDPVPDVFLDVLNNPNYGEGTDWFEAFVREGADAAFQNHNLTVKGGSEHFKGAISGGYLNQQGVLPNSDFKRYSLRTNVEATFGDRLRAGANISVAHTESNSLPVTDMWGIVMQAVVASPLQSPYGPDGEIIPYLPADAPGYFSFPNPLYRARVIKDETVGKDVNGGLNIDFKIAEGLNFKSQVYSRLFVEDENTFVPTTLGKQGIGSAANLSPAAPPFVNSATNQKYDITNWGIDNLLTYDKALGDHSFSGMVGYTAQKQTGELSQIRASDFPTDDHINFLEASEVSANVSDYTNWALDAFFGRVNYDYKAKYLAEVNFRREGSSKFGDNNKFGDFPSASLGWRISEENFYPDAFFINELKLRASYGKTGNSAIGDYERFGTIVSIPNLNNRDNNYNYALGNTVVVGKALTSLGNQDLKWETSTQLDVGLTLGILNDRIIVKADYYRKVTEDMLFNVSLPLASGFSSTRVNVGQMLNTGWDFEVGGSASLGNVSWNSDLNVSFLRNEVTSIPDDIQRIISTYNITEEGAAVGSLYGYVIDGIFNSQQQLDDPALFGWPSGKKLGAFIYRDVNGDKKIDAQDKTIIGNPHPRVILGFNNSFAYKNLSLSILTTGAFGYDIVSELNEWLYNEKGRWNVSTAFLNRWRSPEDPGAGVVPAIHYPGQHTASDDWIEKGNHIWIKNITLGYQIPQGLVEKTGFISGLRFYVSVQNALKFTNYTGWNPQVSTRGGSNPQTLGIDNFSYPIARTYTLGAALSF